MAPCIVKPKVYVGMDLHKNTTTVSVKDRDGAVLDSKKMATTADEFKRYFGQYTDQEVSLALEPVSQWYFYADLLEEIGIDVHIAHPLKVKAIASGKIKTDKIDAGILADLLRANLLPESYFSSKEVRSWKEILRFRASLIHLRVQAKNKVFAILCKSGTSIPESDLYGRNGMKWLRSLEDELLPSFGYALKRYLDLIEYLNKIIQETDSEVEALVRDNKDAKLLTSIPGIAYPSALTIIAEIGDINRFPSAQQLMGYAGLVPSTHASGDKVNHGKITKLGSKWLRWIMIEAAKHQPLCKKEPDFKWYYDKVKKRKGSQVAAVATARKMLAVVWRLLKDQRPFESHPGKSRRLAAKLSSSRTL